MPKPRAPSSIPIAISVKDGRPVCDPFRAHVLPGDTVTWACASPYAIHFKKSTPFRVSVVPGAPDHPAQQVVRPRAAKRAHKYSVIVFAGRRAPLIVDPEIYVDAC